jgi:hypothetical protein
MRLMFVVFAAFPLIVGINEAWAQDASRQKMNDALGQLSSEMLECSVYFLVNVSCLNDSLDPRAPGLARTYFAAGDKMLKLGISTGKSVGVSDESAAAFTRMMTTTLFGERMHSNCVNISVLLERYSNFCKQLSEDADPRLEELLEGKTCTGSYRC